jgi:Na+-transporting methylmalonyl-CoA/oxaloacetate decarboxylase beta subunit
MKKYALIIFIISLLLLVAGLHFTGTLSVILPSDDIGIIGGADRPTANFLINKILSNAYGLLIFFGLATAVCSLFSLIL